MRTPTSHPYAVNYYDTHGRAVGTTSHTTDRDAEETANRLLGRVTQTGTYIIRAVLLEQSPEWPDTYTPTGDEYEI